MPEGHHIFSKVRIIDFIHPTDPENYAKWRNKIWAKHIDFLICDDHSKPVLAIEVDGTSHQSVKRMERDDFVDKVFDDVNFKLYRVPVGSDFSKILSELL